MRVPPSPVKLPKVFERKDIGLDRLADLVLSTGVCEGDFCQVRLD